MRSNTYFSERTRVRARAGRVRQSSGLNAIDEPGNSSTTNNYTEKQVTTMASQHKQVEQTHDYDIIRKRIHLQPSQPTNASYRAMQSLMPIQPTASFTPETWWIVDRQYRPKLRHGATPLVSRCMRAYGWSEAYSRRVLAAYRQFLQLKMAMQDWNGTHLEPSKEIDRLWQQHVMDVCNYAYDCILVCGHVVGYLPDEEFVAEERNQRRWNTKQALENVFTDVDEEIWQDIISSCGVVDESRGVEEKGVELEHTQSAYRPNDKAAERKSTAMAKNSSQNVTSPPIKRPPMTRMERRARSPRKVSQIIDNFDVRKESVQQEARPGSQSPQRVRFQSHITSPHKKPEYTTKDLNRVVAHQSPPWNRNPVFELASPPRPKTPPVVTEPHFSQIFSNAFRTLGFDTRESRTDSPTKRDITDNDSAFDPLEKGEDGRADPIYARRQAFEEGNSDLKSCGPFDSPFMSRNLQKGNMRWNESDDRKPVTIHIRDQFGTVTSSRARRSARLGRIFSAYAISKGVKPAHTHFFLDGCAVDPSDTPASLNLRDYDKIDCVI